MWKCEGLFAEAKQYHCLVARQVSRAVQSADPGLPVRDRAEPQAPALPTLLLAVRAPLVLFDQHRACIAIQPIAPTNQLLNQKSIRTFSTLVSRNPQAVTPNAAENCPAIVSKRMSSNKVPSNVKPGASWRAASGHPVTSTSSGELRGVPPANRRAVASEPWAAHCVTTGPLGSLPPLICPHDL